MTADTVKFRASQIGNIMSGTEKSWSVEKSLTCKRELIKIYRQLIYQRSKSAITKYTEKGIQAEDDAITLLSRVKKSFYKKNTERLTDDYFSGEFDLSNDEETVDIKCSWSLDTFPHPSVNEINSGYKYQGQVYMHLTGKKKHTIAFCLVNTPLFLLIKEKERLYYNMGCPDEGSKHFNRYMNEIRAIEQNMIFDFDQFRRDNPNYDLECSKELIDIPIQDRVVTYSFDFDASVIENVQNRIIECRQWMNEKLFTN